MVSSNKKEDTGLSRQKSGSFLGGTFLLMLSGIVVKVIGAFFSIPLANLYGADGNDIFISAYYVYSAMYVISTAGLPVAVSKMVSEARALGRGREVRAIARVTVITFLILGSVLTLAMMLLVDQICLFIGGSCRYAILAVAPTIFFTCIVSAVRGYFQGMSNMIPTAVSQIIEAMGKLLFGLGLARYLMGAGYTLDIVVAGAIGGVTLGTVFSALFSILYALRHREEVDLPDSGPCRPTGEILKNLVKLAVPITVGASVFSVSALIDTFMVKLRLQEGCFMTDAAAGYTYGAYGYAVKLFNLPLTLVTAIGVSLIPAISGALALRDRTYRKHTNLSRFLCLLQYITNHFGTIRGRLRIRHRTNRGISACCRCRRARRNGFFILQTRLSVMYMQVNKARKHLLSCGINHTTTLCFLRRNLLCNTQNPLILCQNIVIPF